MPQNCLSMPPDLERLVAPNPGPMTLEGTNTYLVGRDPAVVIDPGPDDAGHIEAVREAAKARGGIGTVLLTHGHSDHSGGVAALGVEPERPGDGEVIAGLEAIATPGHAPDHMCFLLPQAAPHAASPHYRSHGGSLSEAEEAAPYSCFTGDLVLGEGSSIVPTRELGGSLRDYMASLRRLAELDLDRLYPGHGPEIDDPEAKLSEYIEHREDRQHRLEAALEGGERSRAALVAVVWDDVPEQLRGAAEVAMQAHLELLQDEGRLPPDIKD
jgi:glyoxylase-like metal-dependent hydrolase (beta-lactamase superfamily II)